MIILRKKSGGKPAFLPDYHQGSIVFECLEFKIREPIQYKHCQLGRRACPPLFDLDLVIVFHLDTVDTDLHLNEFFDGDIRILLFRPADVFSTDLKDA